MYMPGGRQSRSLSRFQIHVLEAFRKSSHNGARHGYSFPQLRMAMGASFGWRTLQKALLGHPVWDLHHAYIVRWIAENLPGPKPRDGKAAAAGEREELEEPTKRGSR
jgi:hypothetical protein